MKNKWVLLFILIPALAFSIAKEGEDLQTIDNWIASTERQLVVHKELRALIADFQQQQDLFQQASEQNSKQLAIQMVQTASNILRIAKEHQLLHLFTPFFVEELTLFASLSKKKNP
jgi:hypothetical protein